MTEDEKPMTPVQKIYKKITREKENPIYIQRVPKQTHDDFMALAEKEFCGDYGMLLKWLMDSIIGQDIKLAMEILQDHEDRLLTLESGENKIAEEVPSIKLCNGKKVEK